MLALRAALKGVQNTFVFCRALPWFKMASKIALMDRLLLINKRRPPAHKLDLQALRCFTVPDNNNQERKLS